MTSLTVNIDEKVKKLAQNKTKQEGLTMTVLISQLLRSYVKGDVSISVISNPDNMITSSFDVTTEEGKEECLNDFKKLVK